METIRGNYIPFIRPEYWINPCIYYVWKLWGINEGCSKSCGLSAHTKQATIRMRCTSCRLYMRWVEFL